MAFYWNHWLINAETFALLNHSIIILYGIDECIINMNDLHMKGVIILMRLYYSYSLHLYLSYPFFFSFPLPSVLLLSWVKITAARSDPHTRCPLLAIHALGRHGLWQLGRRPGAWSVLSLYPHLRGLFLFKFLIDFHAQKELLLNIR